MKRPWTRLPWREFGNGLSMSRLGARRASGNWCFTGSPQMRAADAFVKHEHIGGEFYLVLKGKIADETGEYEKGDIVFLDAHSVHTPRAVGETVVLVLWPAGVRIVDYMRSNRILGGKMKTLGFIGTGGMGSGMAGNLIKAGIHLFVTICAASRLKGSKSQGAVFKESPKAVAESCEIVFSMLPYNEAVRAVGLGTGGLHEATAGAKLWIDFSSIDKKTIVGVNTRAGKKRLDDTRRFRGRSGRSGGSRNLVALAFRFESALR